MSSGVYPGRPPRESGLLWPALWRLALAGGVFLLVYGFCNHFTAGRGDVQVLMWEWERHIPFVPELVVPYWSLDLFFCGAFFLCRSRAELNLLTSRLVAVVLASGVCYLLLPLKIGLERPEPAGWTAPLFRLLYLNDLPHNLAPSLHISLRSLVWTFYGAHLAGALRRWLKLWFILIGASTLLVWQHHLIDVAGGFVMAWIITAVLPDPRQAGPRGKASPRLARRYGAAALLCAALGWGLWVGFVWGAVALGIMALAYATGRPRLLGKENGTLPPASEWCLLPVLLGTRWVLRHWLGRQPAWAEAAPGLLFGRQLSAREAERLLAEHGPLAVLDLTAEANAPVAFRERAYYHNVPLLDLVEPRPEQVAEAVAFIRQHHPERTVYVHCRLGLQRSATVTAGWLAETITEGDRAAAWTMVRRACPEAVEYAQGRQSGDRSGA